jgi:autotransporter-associated beta strand protein
MILGLHQAQAGSASWNAVPGSGSWTTASNWTPATVPSTTADTATFDSSSITNIVSVNLNVGSIVFNQGASAYTFTPFNPYDKTMAGAGIINNSGVLQAISLPAVPQFVGDEESDNLLTFAESATAGTLIQYTLFGSSGADGKTDDGGEIHFIGNSSAGAASFILNSGSRSSENTGDGGIMMFTDSSSAGNATFTLDGGSVSQGRQAFIFFFSDSTAGSATFTNNGGTVARGVGSSIFFAEESSLANATITNNGGSTAEAFGGLTFIDGTASAENAVLIANGGSAAGAFAGATVFAGDASAGNATLIANGGVDTGGKITFRDTVSGGIAHIKVFGNGQLDISQMVAGLTTGSLEGDGLVFLGARTLTLGSNGLSTTFSGVIRDGGISGGTGGSLGRIGLGTLTLAGASTYTGTTTVSGGTLVVTNSIGSATGSGAVQVNAGTLGGGGAVSGAATVGSGGGPGAFLAPAAGTKVPATFTTSRALTLNADATYIYTGKAKGRQQRTDRVVAKGVIINGATFSFQLKTRGTLRADTVFVVISNTAATPISGTFANLADGAVITAGGNNFQASYTGGDGNDLTLTVVP